MLDRLGIHKSQFYFPLIVISVWTIFGLFFGTQNYVRDVYFGRPASLPGYIVGWVLCGYSWGILTWPVLKLANRYSLAKLTLLRFVLVHFVAAIVFSSAQLALYDAIAHLLFGSDRSFWEYYQYLLANEFLSSFLVYVAMITTVTVYARFFGKPNGEIPETRSRSITPVHDLRVSVSQNGHVPTFIRRISVKENGRISLVDTDDIDWIESYGNYVFIFTSTGRYIYRETMTALESGLDPEHFVRIRRSAIVQIHRIKELRPILNGEFDVVLKCDKVLTSSRRYRKNLQKLVR